jgi:hypothetical protein
MAEKARLRCVVATLGCTALALLTRPAGADTAPHDADALFNEARDLMGQGLFGDACPKLAEAQRLAPNGRVTLALAMCHEGEGKLATALVEFARARTEADAAKREDRVSLAEARIRSIEERVSRVTLRVANPAGVSIEIDGAAVDRAAWGAPLPLDGGSHRIYATAPSRRPWESTISLASSGDHLEVRIPELVPDTRGPAAQLAGENERDASRNRERVAGWISGGVGLVALGVGSYFGIDALAKQSDSASYCHDGRCNSPTGVDLVAQAKGRALAADVAFGGGAVALGLATWLLLLRGTSQASAAPSPPHAGLDVDVARRSLGGHDVWNLTVSASW